MFSLISLLNNLMLLLYFHWDPNPDLISLPFLPHPIRWYGLLFALGLLIAYWIAANRIWAYLLHHSNPLIEQDIVNWDLLIQKCRSLLLTRPHKKEDRVLKLIVERLPVPTQQLLQLIDLSNSQKERFKKEFLKTCQECSLKQDSVFSLCSPYLFISKSDLPRVKKRLFLETALSSWITTSKTHAHHITERLSWYIFLGVLIGARLGHVVFYELNHFIAHPIDIFKTWEGGLASHGGVIGIFIAITCYWCVNKDQWPTFRWIQILDIIALTVGFAAGCIRIGNFINQEIIGIPTTVSWAVIFQHPAEDSLIVPRHPVQLYEALSYFCIGIFLIWGISHFKWIRRAGATSGLLLLIIFTCRFCIEFLKVGQSINDTGYLNTGQLLSIPMILIGLLLLYRSFREQDVY